MRGCTPASRPATGTPWPKHSLNEIFHDDRRRVVGAGLRDGRDAVVAEFSATRRIGRQAPTTPPAVVVENLVSECFGHGVQSRPRSRRASRILVAGCVFQLRSRAAEFLESRDRGVQVGPRRKTSQRFTMSPSSVTMSTPRHSRRSLPAKRHGAAWV